MRKITKINEISQQHNDSKKLRVAAYCRVSTNSDSQLESLETQKNHYENYINSRDDWQLVDVYFDEGISGTKKDKRIALLRMLDDCKCKKIDFIVTKSISRFSRNTTDCLELVRKLLDMNVAIYFEKENINTGSMESELMLSILSSMAESESTSISENSTWSTQKRFQNGTYIISSPPFGYENVNGKMVIIPEQATIVKHIFSLALDGKGTYQIAQVLNNKGILTQKGGRWSANTVRFILDNEKYTGDALFQKTYTDSQFTRHHNNGEKNQYMVFEHHTPIITHETFDTVAKLIFQRAKEIGITKGSDKYQNRYTFSGKIVCGNCGNTFKRRTHKSTHQQYYAWCCNTHLMNKDKCSMLFVRETDIEFAFITMMNKLIFARKLILKPLLDSLHTTSKDSNLQKIRELEIELVKINEQKDILTKLMAQNYIDPTIFKSEQNTLLTKSSECKAEIESLNHIITGDSTNFFKLTSLLHFLDRAKMLVDFDSKLFDKFNEHITIHSRNEIAFTLKCGLILTERI